ncbi:MAG: endolytic transglycosylase MltG [Mycoplasmatales bacterium]
MKNKKKIIIIVVIALLILISIFLGFSLLRGSKGGSKDPVLFTITQGEESSVILDDLLEQNLLSSKRHAYKLINKNGYMFYPNTYQLTEYMSDKEVFEILNSPTSNVEDLDKLVVPEGYNVYNIASSLAEFDRFGTKEEILDYWSNNDVLNTIIDKYSFITDAILNKDILYPLEGYFYPATYPLADGITLEDITYSMLDTMQSKLSQFNIKDEDVHSMLTMASIVERETLLKEDKKTAAGVFYNRIEQDMPFQSDITVLYAKQEHKERVLYSDLKYQSPYNTYLHTGLPPGPIASPSFDSIDAAVNPEDNDYLYFFAKQDTGELLFSKTYEEHQKIAKENAWQF